MHEQKEAINEKNDIPYPCKCNAMLMNKVGSSLANGGKRNNYSKEKITRPFCIMKLVKKKCLEKRNNNNDNVS